MDDRHALLDLLAQVQPWDDTEADHLSFATSWAGSGAPLYRTGSAELHLVSYVVPFDEATGRIMLTAHRKSGLWLPPGGHVEAGETPWQAAFRETAEELGIAAAPWPGSGTTPLFVTVTTTRGDETHRDVSLWHVIAATDSDIGLFDEREFSSIRWSTLADARSQPADTTDPHLTRFVAKLAAHHQALQV